MDAAALIALLEQRDAELAALMQVITKLQKSINIKNKKIFGSTSEKLSVLSPEEHDKGYVPFEDVTKDAVEAAKESADLPAPKRRYKKPHPGQHFGS